MGKLGNDSKQFIIDNLHKFSRQELANKLGVKYHALVSYISSHKLNPREKIDDQYIIDNFEKLSTEEMAKNLNTSISTINRHAMDCGLEYKSRKIDIDNEYLKANYQILSLEKMANHFNVGKHIVQKRAKEIGIIKEQKYKYNQDYFKTWSHSMAYILGFIFADGCITIDDNKSYGLHFGQNPKDKSVLEFISKELGENLIIHEKSQFDKRTLQTYYSSRLSIHCKEIVDDLIKLNICERKTGKEKLPEIPKEFKMSFLCGYHDGDGHLRNDVINGNYHFEFTCMNEKFLLDLQSKICDGLGKVEADRDWFTYKIRQKQVCQELDKKMTENVSFYLKRKHF